MAESNKKLAYESLRPHLTNLHYTGFLQMSHESPRSHRVIYGYYMLFILITTLTYLTLQLLKLIHVRNDTDKVIGQLFILLTILGFVYKQLILMFRGDDVIQLLDIMKGSLFNPASDQFEYLLLRTAKLARIVLWSFNGMAVATSMTWQILQSTLYITRRSAEFYIWMPFDVNTSPNFYIALATECVGLTLTALNNTTIDAFISFMFAQGKTQLIILRIEMENLIQTSKEDKSKPFHDSLQDNFARVVAHYNEIIRFIEKIQEIFGGVLFFHCVADGWTLCTTAYTMIQKEQTATEFVAMMLYMISVLIEMSLYCYFGNEVYYESCLLTDSAYAMDWLEMPVKNRKDLIILMERMKRPIQPYAGHIIPLSNSTLLSMLRSSYTFFAFLKNVDDS